MNPRFLSTFLADESGAITVEAVIWISGLVGLGTMVGQKIVAPLIEQAHAQAVLNQESLDLINSAMAVCTGGA